MLQRSPKCELSGFCHQKRDERGMVSNSLWQKQRGQEASLDEISPSSRKTIALGRASAQEMVTDISKKVSTGKGGSGKESQRQTRSYLREGLSDDARGFLEPWDEFSCLACCSPIFLQDFTACLFENGSPLLAGPNVSWNFSEQYGLLYQVPTPWGPLLCFRTADALGLGNEQHWLSFYY